MGYSTPHPKPAMRKIQITLRPDGTQKVEVLDAVGTDCLEFSGVFEKRLGTQEGERVFKPEFYETEAAVERVQERESEQERGG